MRGYKEEGTTTTPFDMVVLNDIDRFHLVIDVIDRVPGLGPTRPRTCGSTWPRSASRHRAYTREVGDDMPDVRDWSWEEAGSASVETLTPELPG